jgi:hypothetical protein
MVFLLFGACVRDTPPLPDAPGAQAIKILHLMSYHQGWPWSDDQFRGFREALQGLSVEYETFQMDTKRRSDEAWKVQVGRAAQERVKTWKPALVYASDDNARKYAGRRLADAGIPVVFSGVNGEPADYGYDTSPNVRGVLEREPVLETVSLLRELAPGTRRIVCILDVDITWTDIARRIQALVPERYPDISVVNLPPILTFAEYKRTVLEYQEPGDAFALLGIYAFKDEAGKSPL